MPRRARCSLTIRSRSREKSTISSLRTGTAVPTAARLRLLSHLPLPRLSGARVRSGSSACVRTTVRIRRAGTARQGPPPIELFALFDQEADLAVHAIHRDPVVFDDAFRVFDPERLDAAKRLGRFPDRLLAGVVKAVRRLGDYFYASDDRHAHVLLQ